MADGWRGNVIVIIVPKNGLCVCVWGGGGGGGANKV